MKHINKYSYQIKQDQSLGTIVIEFVHNIKSQIWFLKTLIEFERTELYDSTSFDRTLSWLKENHPELLI
jgi:hypothetical protein